MDMRYDVDVRKMNDPVLTKAELVKELRALVCPGGWCCSWK